MPESPSEELAVRLRFALQWFVRCFIAIHVPEAIRGALARLSAELRSCRVRAKWARPEQMHLTLRFLGEITPDQCATISAHMAKSTRKLAPFQLRVHGVGAFPNVRRANIIWSGVGPSDGPLAQLQMHCEAAARSAGLTAEPRAFFPHITLTRLTDRRPPEDLILAIERHQTFIAGEFTVEGVSLCKSELTQGGPVHSRLQEFPLPWTS